MFYFYLEEVDNDTSYRMIQYSDEFVQHQPFSFEYG